MFFWRIGERPRTTWGSGFGPILQKIPWPLAMEMPERLRTFDLVASHHQIKNNFLFAISLPAGRQRRLSGEYNQFYIFLSVWKDRER
jgi:hypothetical protein